MGLGAIGAAIGEGYTAAQANLPSRGILKIPEKFLKTMLVGQAVAESASIFALVIAILLLFLDVPVPTFLKAAALFGAGISMGFGAIGSGIGSGYPGGKACAGIATTAGRSLPIDDQYAHRLGGLSNTSHIFHGCGPDADVYQIFGDAPLSPTWAAVSRRRHQYGTGGHRFRYAEVVWQPGPAAKELPDSPKPQQT